MLLRMLRPAGLSALWLSALVPSGEARGPQEADQELAGYSATIVVTANRSEQEVRDVPAAVSVIDGRRIAIDAGDDIGDLLRREPGLNSSELAARDINIGIRQASGITARNVLALVDGRTLYQDFFGFVMWDLAPIGLDQLSQIEVVRGPGSAVWGANAMNGVVNLITKRPADSVGTRLRLGLGEVGTVDGSVSHTDVKGRLAYRLAGSFYRQDAWDRDNLRPDGTPFPPQAAFENRDTEQPKLDARFDFTPNDRETWTFAAGGARTTGVIHGASGPLLIDRVFQSYGQAKYQRDTLELNLFGTVYDGDFTAGLSRNDSYARSHTFQLEASDLTDVGENHRLVYGTTVRHSHFALDSIRSPHHRNEFGAYLEDQVQISEQVEFSLGARADWFGTFGWGVSPRATVRLRPHQDHTLRASYGRAYAAPSHLENYVRFQSITVLPTPDGSLHFAPFLIAGNSELSRQTMDALEIGYLATRGRATFSASVYYNRTRNLIRLLPIGFYSPASPPPGWNHPDALVPVTAATLGYLNVGRVDDQGLEAGLSLDLTDGWSANANYSYQDDPEVDSSDAGFPIPVNVPPTHRFNLGLAYDGGRYLGTVDYGWTDEAFWADVLNSPFHGTTDSFGTFNATIGMRLPEQGLTLMLKGSNLSDEPVKQHVFGDIIRRKIVGEVRLAF